MEQPADQTLLEAIRRDDEAAFDQLFRTHYPALCRFAAPILDGDVDEAEDIVQQVFVRFWEQRHALDIQFSVKAYLFKMVQNRSLNHIRAAMTREKFKIVHSKNLEKGHDPVASSDSELQLRLQRALEKLPRECRRIFELSRFEELKYREIAENLQISIKTVETQMGKALRLMRSELADYLVVAFWFLLWKFF